jgi:glycosyltransferase involved in cell wall biosynthesis
VTELRVALVTEEYPPFSFGGISSVCYDLAHALSAKGVQTTVFCGRSKTMKIERVNKNLQIIRLPCFNMPPRFLWFQLQNLAVLKKLLRNYSVLHIVNPEAGPIIAHVARVMRIPTVTSIHGSYFYTLRKNVSSPFSDWNLKDLSSTLISYPLHFFSMYICIKLSNRLAVCSLSTVAELKALIPGLDLIKVSAIPNGIRFSLALHQNHDSTSGCKIIFYGRLIRLKGVQYLIRASAQLRNEFPNIRLQIFGSGPYRKEIDNLISDLALTENVEVHNQVARTELWEQIQKADVVVLPSLHEAQPVSILEGMAYMKPVVVFDFPFSREIITNMQNGVLAKPGDMGDLADKIRMLLENRELCSTLGKNARAHVRLEHNWSRLAERYIQLYKDAIVSVNKSN